MTGWVQLVSPEIKPVIKKVPQTRIKRWAEWLATALGPGVYP